MKKDGKQLVKVKRKKVYDIIKNVNKVLKNNSEIIDFFSKIVLAIISINIAINANKIAEHQQKIDEMDVLTNIIVETENKDYESSIHIKNVGAPVYNVNVESQTLITCIVNDPEKAIRKFIQIPIDDYYFDAVKTGNHTETLARISCNTITHDFKEFSKFIENKCREDGILSFMKLDTIVKLTYEDYLERRYEEYFKVSPYLSIRLNKEEINQTEEYINYINEPIKLNSLYYDKIIEIYEDPLYK